MRRAFRYLPLLAVPLLCTQFARAQAGVDINLGFGSAHDSANSGGLDSATGNACTPSSGGTCESLSALSGFFMGIGGDIMFRKQFGVGADVSFQPARSNYGPFQSRQT